MTLPDASWQPENSRKIKKRIVVQGSLVLQTLASLSNGDNDDQVDLPLLTDALEGKPLLTGSSIAGAVRAYLREIDARHAELLFGTNAAEPQSPLIVEDSLGEGNEVEVRDGVRLDSKSRTAVKDALYNRECWAAGTIFPLLFELLICHDDDETMLRTALATALLGFESEQIPVGGRKTRGYGRAKVEIWEVREYDLTTPRGLADWIYARGISQRVSMKSGLKVTPLPDGRNRFVLDAKFWLDGSLLIRSVDRGENAPDMVHLKAKRTGKPDVPILSGTSVAGAMRARALKIANTLNKQDAGDIIDALFGPLGASGKPLKASRLLVWEHEIKEGIDHLVQSRVSIDRFTGGARDQFLFNQQPVFGDNATIVHLHFELKPSKDESAAGRDSEIGLLLLLLKDLWTGDLPLGGESSVGRGRLHGKRADVKYNGVDYAITEKADGTLQISEEARVMLESAVGAWSAKK